MCHLRTTLHSTLLAAVAVLLVAGCSSSPDQAADEPADEIAEQPADEQPAEQETAEEDVDEPEAEADDVADDEVAEDEEAEETVDEDAYLEPQFVLPGHPVDEQDRREQMTARNSVRIPVYEEPTTDSTLLDHLELDEGEAVEPVGEVKQIVNAERLESPVDFTTFGIAEKRGEQGPAHTVEQGEEIALYREYLGDDDVILHVWHDGGVYKGVDTEDGGDRDELLEAFGFDTDTVDRAFDFERDEWWVEVDTGEKAGWLNATHVTLGPEEESDEEEADEEITGK